MFTGVVDAILSRSEKQGDLSDLPGQGKPLDLTPEPKDAVIDRLMKGARVKPPAVTLKQKITESAKRLKNIENPEDRKAEMKVLSDLQLRYAIEMEAMRRYG